MSSKISALASATATNNADLLTSVQAGVNKKLTRAVLLTAATGEVLALTGNGGTVSIGGSGSVSINIPSGVNLIFTSGSTSLNVSDSFGSLYMAGPTGHDWLMYNNGATITIDSVGNITLVPAGGHNTTVNAGTPHPAYWSGSPATLNDAIDRIAKVVSVNGVTPIP
jgi:hypothetical protein